VSLALEAVVVAGGIFLGRLLSRAFKRRQLAARRIESGEGDGEAGDGAAAHDGDADSDAGAEDENADENADEALEGFACRLGDVVLRRVEGDEAWLAGGIVLAEERAVAALFIAPEGRGERAVFVPGPNQTTLTWLAPIAGGDPGLASVAPGGEPPSALEHAGTRFARTRRLPVRAARVGTGAPDVGQRAILGEYAADGAERLLVIAGTHAARAWRGVALLEGAYEVLPGGKSTLRG
jgi:hypothetical protein